MLKISIFDINTCTFFATNILILFIYSFCLLLVKKKCDNIECVSIMNTHFVDAVDMRQKFVAYESLNLCGCVRLALIYYGHSKQQMLFHRTKFDR